MNCSSASSFEHKKARKDNEEAQCHREDIWELTEDLHVIPRASLNARKRSPSPASRSGNPRKARRSEEEAQISRANEIWDLTGDEPHVILSPTSAEKTSSMPRNEPEHPTVDPLPKFTSAESQDKTKGGKKRGRPKRPVALVPVPLRRRPKGVPVPAVLALANERFQNYNSSNKDGLRPFYDSTTRSSSLVRQSPYTGRAGNSFGNQRHTTATTNGKQRASEGIVVPEQSLPSTPMQPHQLSNALIDRSAHGSEGSTSPVTLQEPRGTHAHANNLQSIPAQVPNCLSSTPRYIWSCIPQEQEIASRYSEIDQRSHPRNDVIPSWAVGRPLCLQLSRTEIGQSFNPLQTPDQVSPVEPDSLPQYFRRQGSNHQLPWLQSPPVRLPQQPYQTYAQQFIQPQPLGNPTSFFNASRCGFRMWPYLKLGLIRNKDFLSSCKSRNQLKLISRYLLEHALDQIARHDPSSELEPKWLMTPRNIYTKGARDLLQGNDCQQGFCCSCKPETEKNRSGTSGSSCSDGRCENRAMNIECVPGRCGAGEFCQNVRLQKPRFPFAVLQKFPGKGHGVIALEIIRPGTMIGEYLGEVLTEEVFERRMLTYQGEQNFYFMRLTSKLVIDGSRKAGITRFINHSCDPNCTAEKWNAGGEPHVAIVAKREIRPDEEITFSYQAQTMGTKTRCKCGSAKCQGWLTPTSFSEDECPETISADGERIVEMKIRQAQSDIALAEEILQKLYARVQA